MARCSTSLEVKEADAVTGPNANWRGQAVNLSRLLCDLSSPLINSLRQSFGSVPQQRGHDLDYI